ncbi:GntR family transcriptional regulator [Luedemannella flava]|uniref:GntR family transcriptional regulator n=1 Tax=Luedemannella flava TaxID=349316 RepID=A0ABP4YNI1_9ACTN
MRLAIWRPVRAGNALEITVARLVQAIRLGAVAVGEQLPAERVLADQLQVSRVTLRDAIAELRDAGYLESRRGRGGGTFVIWSGGGAPGVREDAAAVAREMGDTLPDALEFRRVLEGGAAGLAASRTLTAADRAQLTAALEASRHRDPQPGEGADDPVRAGQGGAAAGGGGGAGPGGGSGTGRAPRRVNDSRLHLAIASVAGSPSLLAGIADVQLTLDRLLAAIPVLPRNLDHSDEQHTRIVGAILAGDPAGARAAMEEHCDATAELLRALIA